MGFKDFVGSLYNGAKEYGEQFMNWGWKNKGNLLNYGGKAISAAGAIKENPWLVGAGAAVSGLGKTINEGEAKEAYQKELEEQRMRQYGNRYIGYSDMPRIHYSKKPYSYILHHPKFSKYDDDTFLVKHMINHKHKLKARDEKQKNKVSKQKEYEQKLKEKWERQAQTKKDREEKKAQAQKEKEQRQEQRKKAREERQKEQAEKKAQAQKEREQKRAQKSKPKSPAVLDKSFRDDLKAAFKMYKEGK